MSIKVMIQILIFIDIKFVNDSIILKIDDLRVY